MIVISLPCGSATIIFTVVIIVEQFKRIIWLQFMKLIQQLIAHILLMMGLSLLLLPLSTRTWW